MCNTIVYIICFRYSPLYYNIWVFFFYLVVVNNIILYTDTDMEGDYKMYYT